MSNAVIESIRLAEEGLDSAACERYREAINLFTQAIRLHDKDFRYFINRSYCYYHLELYELSLDDAIAAIKIAPDHPKPHFRSGLALFALRRWEDALKSFEKVIEVDDACEASKTHKKKCRLFLLQEAGFTEKEAQELSEGNVTVEELIKNKRNRESVVDGVAKLSIGNHVAKIDSSTMIKWGNVDSMTVERPEISVNGDSMDKLANIEVKQSMPDVVPSSPGLSNSNKGNVSSPIGLLRRPHSGGSSKAQRLRSSGDLDLTGVLAEVIKSRPDLLNNDTLATPTNLLGYNSLYVSNLHADIQKKTIMDIFTKYGEVVKVGVIRNKELPFKQVAIHYNNPVSPAAAIADLRDKIFADEPKVTQDPMKPLIMMFTPDMNQRLEKLTFSEAMAIVDDEKECFDWRGPAGCESRSDCTGAHVRINCGVDSHLYLIPDPEPEEP